MPCNLRANSKIKFVAYCNIKPIQRIGTVYKGPEAITHAIPSLVGVQLFLFITNCIYNTFVFLATMLNGLGLDGSQAGRFKIGSFWKLDTCRLYNIFPGRPFII
jgi:hypothetical protein